MLNIPTANIKTNMIHFFIPPLRPFILSKPLLLPDFPKIHNSFYNAVSFIALSLLHKNV